MAVYKSPGVYTKDVDYWIPSKSYNTFTRKYKINKIFNLGRDIYADTFTLINNHNSHHRRIFKIPVGGPTNNTNVINKLKQYISSFKI